MVVLRFFIFLIFLSLSCGSSERASGWLDIDLVMPPDQTPLNGVSGILITVMEDGKVLQSDEFPVNTRAGSLEGLPAGVSLRVIVEGLDDSGGVISRGRTGEVVLEPGKRSAEKVFFSNAGSFSGLKTDMNRRDSPGISFLEKGSILITGGLDEAGNVLDTSEIYEHSEISFRASGRLTAARANHSQVQARDRKVVLAGGSNTSKILQSIEVFDANSGAFIEAASLSAPRRNATANVLDGGGILICGGFNEVSALNTCEIFQPDSDRIEVLPDKMTGFRSGHSGLMLPDGKLILTGGRNLDTLELFSQGEGFTMLKSRMSVPRENFFAGFLNDNEILFACGQVSARPEVLRIPEMEIYIPEKSPNLTPGCSAEVMEDGRIFVAGGMEGTEKSDKAMILRSSTFETEWTGRMLSRRSNAKTLLLHDGTLLILGGTEAPPYAELFNPP